jgi:hypothetical protein
LCRNIASLSPIPSISFFNSTAGISLLLLKSWRSKNQALWMVVMVCMTAPDVRCTLEFGNKNAHGRDLIF